MDQAVKDYVSNTSQGRPRGEDAWYSPARDITTLTPVLARCAFEAWEDAGNEYRRHGDRRMYTDEDICRVAEALATFMGKESIVDASSFEDAYQSSGLADVPIGARTVILAMMAEDLLCAFWFAARTATTVTSGGDALFIQYDPKALAERAAEFSRVFRLSPRRRWLQKCWWKLRLWLLRKLKANESKEPTNEAHTKELPGTGH